MILIEEIPKDPILRKYIDRYQYFHIDEASYLKTIPNGKFELYAIFSGGMDIWDLEKEEFKESEKFGFLPATSKASLIRIPESLICLNIKMNLSSVSLIWFKEVYHGSSNTLNKVGFFKEMEQIASSEDLVINKKLNIDSLEKQLSVFFATENTDPEVFRILNSIQGMEDLTVEKLSSDLNISSRTLNRFTKKYFDLSPKELFKVLRFEKTTSFLKENESEGLIEAISFGYYDQSHFIKECRKITGISPRKLFEKMKLPTNDLLVGKNQEGFAEN